MSTVAATAEPANSETERPTEVPMLTTPAPMEVGTAARARPMCRPTAETSDADDGRIADSGPDPSAAPGTGTGTGGGHGRPAVCDVKAVVKDDGRAIDDGERAVPVAVVA